MSSHEPVPNFYLYGEPHRSVDDHFLHVESLDVRSRPADWTIRPHAHRELNHLFLVTGGGGVMQAEGALTDFEAPCLLLIPSRVVHGFRWHAESSGAVITVADHYTDELVRRDPDAAALFAAPTVAALSKDSVRLLSGQARSLMRELAWFAPGHRTAVDAVLALIVVRALRALSLHREEGGPSRGRQAELVARFRALVEDRFRLREPFVAYAARLGVSATTLRTACARVAGKPPAEILNLRAFLEARRSLCYSNLTVAEIAYNLGFVDPAYFTRSFTRHAGRSPRQFRMNYERGAMASASAKPARSGRSSGIRRRPASG